MLYKCYRNIIGYLPTLMKLLTLLSMHRKVTTDLVYLLQAHSKSLNEYDIQYNLK